MDEKKLRELENWLSRLEGQLAFMSEKICVLTEQIDTGRYGPGRKLALDEPLRGIIV